MSTRLLRKATGLLAALTGLVVILAGPGAAAATIQDIRILYVDVIFCDDEAEIGSDEITLLVAGNFVNSRTNMDGGDWWDIKLEFAFEETITIELKEWSGWTIGFSTIDASEAHQGVLWKHYFGHHGTNFYYRVLYVVT